MVFVAMGDDNRPTVVEPWVPNTEIDKALADAAVKLMESSQTILHETREAI
ncbi:unnamed protein product, partial [marine sediment metagenome]